MCIKLMLLPTIALMAIVNTLDCAPVPTSTGHPVVEYPAEDSRELSAVVRQALDRISSNETDAINATDSSNASRPANVLTVSEKDPLQVVELILSDGERGPRLSVPKESDSRKAEDVLEINLDETRDELLQALENDASVEVDEAANEHIRTISEDKLRITLERILRRQLDSARKKHHTHNGSTIDSITIYNHTTPISDAAAISSQLICQFFVFGTLFGVVCSISTCTCCLRPRSDRRSGGDLNAVNPTNVPAPIDYSKPYMLKCDSRGSCYASPLDDDEVPPLPSYADALSCATQPSFNSQKPADPTVFVI